MEQATLIVYHRGGGKSEKKAPNAFPTIQWAIENGAKAIEFDVAYCADQDRDRIILIEPVILKDHGFDIDNLDFEDVENLNANIFETPPIKICEIEDVLRIVPDTINMQIHIKGSHVKTVPCLLSKLEKTQNFIITSFDAGVLKNVSRVNFQIRTGWIVKSDNSEGNEKGEDLTAKLSSGALVLQSYTVGEIETLIETAQKNQIDVLLLCGPRILSADIVDLVKAANLKCGAWGVGQNLDLARHLINLKLDRFTLDNPEQL